MGAKLIREKERKYVKAAKAEALDPNGRGDVVVLGKAGQHSQLVFVAVPQAADIARQIESEFRI